jgi:hypothetical protein
LETIVDIFACVSISAILFLFIYSNYKIFIIAKSKRADERVAATTARDENRKTRTLNLKSISIRVLWQLAVFSVVSAPTLYMQLYVQHQERRSLRGNFCYLDCGQTRLLV